MKKIKVLTVVASILMGFSAYAGGLVHVGVGASVGTDGIGFDAAATVTSYFGVRAGASFMPKISPKVNVNTVKFGTKWEQNGDVKVQGDIKWSDFKLLFDVYPFASGFHVTAGAFIGGDSPVKAQNIDPIDADGGIEIGGKIIEADADGIARACIKTNSFKPYLGLGFGKAVPGGRVSVTFDMGVKFWGSPSVYAYDPATKAYDSKAEEGDFSEEGGKIIKVISKVKVYPVLSLRICGRIF